MTRCPTTVLAPVGALTEPVADAKKNDLGRMPAQVGTGSVSAPADDEQILRRALKRLRFEAAPDAPLTDLQVALALAYVAYCRCEGWRL